MKTPELTKLVNEQAVKRYRQLAKQIGAQSLTLTLAKRLALRFDTPYPYSFVDDTEMYPKDKRPGFGRVVHKSRQAGLRAIHREIGSKNEEHGWLFVPSAGLWIDSSLGAEDASVEQDQYLEAFLSYAFRGLESLHTHPDKVVRKLHRDESWAYSSNYLLEAARPSGPDLQRYIQMRSRSAPNCELLHSVVSHHGVTTYRTGKLPANTGYMTDNYERRILNANGKPERVIQQKLAEMRWHELLRNGREPTFNFTFDQL